MISVCQVLLPRLLPELFSEKQNKQKNKLISIKTTSLLIQMFHLCLVIPEHGHITSTAPPTIREENCKCKSHQQAHKQILHFLTYWLCLFKFHVTLSEVLPLVKSHFLINITHWFNALTLEHYMTLTYMPWRRPPWRTWNRFINTFPYFHMIIEEAWTWPLRWESSRAQPGASTPSYSYREKAFSHKWLNFTMTSPSRRQRQKLK